MHSLQHMGAHTHPRTCLRGHTQHVRTNIYRSSHLLWLCKQDTSRGFRDRWLQWILRTIYLLQPSLPALPLQYGLSTSLLSVWQWYQAKNVSSVDSRHEGTAAYTSASEPASWGIHSSGQVNTGALWNATHSFSLREAEPVKMLYKFTLYKGVWWYSKPEGSIYKSVFMGWFPA